MRTNIVTITGVQNYDQRVGSNDCVTFDAVTSEREPLVLVLTQYYLEKRAGVDLGLLDSLAGSTLEIKNSADRDGVVTATAEERIESALDGTYPWLLTSAANIGNLKKSAVYKDDANELKSSTNAKVVIENRKEQLRARAARRIEELRSRREIINDEHQDEPPIDDDDDVTEKEPNFENAPSASEKPATGTKPATSKK